MSGKRSTEWPMTTGGRAPWEPPPGERPARSALDAVLDTLTTRGLLDRAVVVRAGEVEIRLLPKAPEVTDETAEDRIARLKREIEETQYGSS